MNPGGAGWRQQSTLIPPRSRWGKTRSEDSGNPSHSFREKQPVVSKQEKRKEVRFIKTTSGAVFFCFLSNSAVFFFDATEQLSFFQKQSVSFLKQLGLITAYRCAGLPASR